MAGAREFARSLLRKLGSFKLAVLKLWSQDALTFLKLLRTSKDFYLYRLNLLILDMLEIKTGLLKRKGFPCGSAGKESSCSARDLGSTSGLGRSPGKGNGYPLRYSGLEKSMGVAKRQITTEWLSFFHKQKPITCWHFMEKKNKNTIFLSKQRIVPNVLYFCRSL